MPAGCTGNPAGTDQHQSCSGEQPSSAVQGRHWLACSEDVAQAEQGSSWVQVPEVPTLT